jgi:hypothetical protein
MVVGELENSIAVNNEQVSTKLLAGRQPKWHIKAFIYSFQ